MTSLLARRGRIPDSARYAMITVGLLLAIGSTAPVALSDQPYQAELEIHFYVSPDGNDDVGIGTRDAPWATIARARDHIRAEQLNADMAANIIVNIAPGEYVFDEAVAFGMSDSGAHGHFIIYRASEGPGTVRFVGSAKVDSWEPHTDTIWKINLGPGLTVDSVFENEARGRLARTPNHVFHPRYPMGHGPYRVSVQGGHDTVTGWDWLEYAVGDEPPEAFTTAARLVWWSRGGKPDWNMVAPRLRQHDAEQRRLYFDPVSPDYSVGPEPDRYFIDGIFELLDAPGEFYYVREDGWLYYYPRSGGDPSDQDIRIPVAIPMLIAVIGPEPGQQAGYLRFEGITFAYTSSNSERGTVDLRHSRRVEIIHCHFHSTGRYAITMRDDNYRNRVYGCLIRRVGRGAIIVDNRLMRADYPDAFSAHHVISNCKIHDIGEESIRSLPTTGVALFNTRDSVVSHCEIYNSGRYAISLRGHWSTQRTPHDIGLHVSQGNRFEYIRATDGMNDSGDGGIMHAAHCNGQDDPLGSGHINYWNQILLSGAYADPSMLDVPPNGIFFDHPFSCLYQDLSNIKIAWTQGDPYRGNRNPVEDQTTENVSFTGTFDEGIMAYDLIGLRTDFPLVYDAQDIVIADDHTIDYEEAGGGWVNTTIGGLYGGDGRYRTHAPGSTASWIPTFPATRTYEVSIWRPNPASSPASSYAPYTIYHADGVAEVTVDQQGGAGWVPVGTYSFVAGRDATQGSIQLSADTADERPVRADAVRFVAVGPKTPQAKVHGELSDTQAHYEQWPTLQASGGSGTGPYEFRQNGGTGWVEFLGHGDERIIRFLSSGTADLEVRRAGDVQYEDAAWVPVGTAMDIPAHPLPYAEDFEWTADSVPVDFGWISGINDQSLIQALTYEYDGELPLPEGTHEKVLHLHTGWTPLTVKPLHDPDSAPIVYWDKMVYFVPRSQPLEPSLLGPETKLAYAMNRDGHLLIYHGGADGDTDTVSVLDGRFTPETWRRVTITVDMESADGGADAPIPFFQMQIDGEVQSSVDGAGFATPSHLPEDYSGGNWFRFANYNAHQAQGMERSIHRIGFRGTGTVDDFVLTDVAPTPPPRKIYRIRSITGSDGTADPAGEVDVKSGDYLTIIYEADEWFHIGTLTSDGGPVAEATGVERYEWRALNISADITNQVDFVAILWEGDNQTPLWWADQVAYTDGTALTVREGYLINQEDLDLPFTIREIGRLGDGRLFIRWHSTGPAHGELSVQATEHITGTPEWLMQAGESLHAEETNTWTSTGPIEPERFLRIQVQ